MGACISYKKINLGKEVAQKDLIIIDSEKMLLHLIQHKVKYRADLLYFNFSRSIKTEFIKVGSIAN